MIANAYTPARADEISNLEFELVEAAAKRAPKALASIVRYVTDAIDGDGGAASDAAAYERRAGYAAMTLNGFDLRANADFAEGQEVLDALHEEMAGDLQDHDPRRTPQRRWDALYALIVRGRAANAAGMSQPVRHRFCTVIDLHELPGSNADLVASVRAEVRHTGYLSRATIERLTCDAAVSRILTAGKSEILDVGRATRTISPALWKALVVRDRHCQAPGCNRTPDRCQAHHIVHWALGGPTRLDNLRLLCWHHHREEHRHGAPLRAADRGP